MYNLFIFRNVGVIKYSYMEANNINANDYRPLIDDDIN